MKGDIFHQTFLEIKKLAISHLERWSGFYFYLKIDGKAADRFNLADKRTEGNTDMKDDATSKLWDKELLH